MGNVIRFGVKNANIIRRALLCYRENIVEGALLLNSAQKRLIKAEIDRINKLVQRITEFPKDGEDVTENTVSENSPR